MPKDSHQEDLKAIPFVPNGERMKIVVMAIKLKKESRVKLRNSSLEDSVADNEIIGGGSLLPQGRFFIQFRSPTTSKEGQGVLVEAFDTRVLHRHLLWHLLFRGTSSLEWMMLYQKLESQLRVEKNMVCACLTLLLTLSSKTRKRFEHWSSKTKPIHKQLISITPKADSQLFEQYDSLLDYSVSQLRIPQKGMSLKELYRVQKVSIPIVRPTEEQYVGVGYKDKGSMSPQEVIELPEDVSKFQLESDLERKTLKSLLRFFDRNFEDL